MLNTTLRSLPLRALVGLVRGYRFFLSPSLGSQCRFEPTCSLYAIEALETHGAAAGSYLAARRLLRCHPWCAGGHDPVPHLRHSLFGFSNAERPDIAGSASSNLRSKTLP